MSKLKTEYQSLKAGVISSVVCELDFASEQFPPFNSAHEGYAVLLEEVEELKAHVFTNQKKRDAIAMRHEAVQVAAMAFRFIHDCCQTEQLAGTPATKGTEA